MSSAQIEELLAPNAPVEPIEVQVDPPTEVEPPPQTVEAPPQHLEPSNPPKQEEISSCTSKVLKTRKGLIQQIRTVCQERGVDPKPMNLARRRKNSLKGILQDQLREAIQRNEPDCPP